MGLVCTTRGGQRWLGLEGEGSVGEGTTFGRHVRKT